MIVAFHCTKGGDRWLCHLGCDEPAREVREWLMVTLHQRLAHPSLGWYGLFRLRGIHPAVDAGLTGGRRANRRARSASGSHTPVKRDFDQVASHDGLQGFVTVRVNRGIVSFDDLQSSVKGFSRISRSNGSNLCRSDL